MIRDLHQIKYAAKEEGQRARIEKRWPSMFYGFLFKFVITTS